MQRIPNTDEVEIEKFYASYTKDKTAFRRMNEFICSLKYERIVITDTYTDEAIIVADSEWMHNQKQYKCINKISKDGEYYIFGKDAHGSIKIRQIRLLWS
jgi:hypothetical protein